MKGSLGINISYHSGKTLLGQVISASQGIEMLPSQLDNAIKYYTQWELNVKSKFVEICLFLLCCLRAYER